MAGNKTMSTRKAISYAITTGSTFAKALGYTAPGKQRGGNITKARK